MDGLKRSEISFRRQGSSGLVWDDKLFSGELKEERGAAGEDGDDDKVKGGVESKEANKGLHVREQNYRTVKDVSPTIDPPSPKVSTCGFCSMFGTKPPPQQKKKQQQQHRQPQPKPKSKRKL